MNKKITLGGAITIAIMLSTVTFITTMIYAQKAFDSQVFNIKERETMYVKLSEVDRLVRQRYYNAIDEDTLGGNLVKGYLNGIEDKYATYLTAENYTQTMNSLDGKMVGVGIVASQSIEGYIYIDEVYDDSPASVGELLAGDLIIKVDELDVTLENYDAAVDAIRGEPGTTVTLVVRRDNVDKSYTLTRRRVDIPSISSRVIDTVGYIKINEFNENSPDQFSRHLASLIEVGVKALVFDVRDNGGGTLDSVGQILDRLLPEGPVAYAAYKGVSQEILLKSDAEEVNLPMAVIINSRTASAAELFAQALKDYNKARIVGVTSYGKGSMQEIHKLSDGSAINFTVALFNPPFSPNFEGIGVKPDYEIKLSAELEKELEYLDEYADLQLKKAIEVVSGAVREQQPDPESPTIETPESPESVDSETLSTHDLIEENEDDNLEESSNSSASS